MKGGIGRYMLLWVYSKAVTQSGHIGCRIVYLNPEDYAVDRYTKMGLAHIKSKHKQDIIFYDMNKCKKQLAQK